MITNYEIFLRTVKTLAGSQGFYSRLQSAVNEWTEEEHENAKQSLNQLPQWRDDVDCVLFLEQ